MWRMGTLGKIARLNARQRRALALCLRTMILVRLGLAVFPYRSVRRHFADRLRPASGPALDPAILAWATRHAARAVPAATCLTQALTLQITMARFGHSSLVRIGVARGADGRLKAHAWLVSAGQTLIGGRALMSETYTPITDLELSP